MSDEYDYLFKSIVVGDGGVGKTALTLRFSKGFFTEDYKMTIGVDFHVKTISIDTEDEGQLRVKLQIWDTGGQERFSSIRPMYYRGSLGALLIFDLTSYESFEHLPQWIEEVRANIKNEVPFLLVGNKSDLIDERAVTLEEINNFTEKFNLYYMDTSAKTGDGVGDCFYILACLMVGAGVPNQLVSKGIVSSPGKILAKASSSPTEITPQIEPTPLIETEPVIEYVAPPVPEPEPEITLTPPPKPESSFIPEPEPKVPFIPEPEPEFTLTPPPKPESSFIPEPKIETSTEQAGPFVFKTQDEKPIQEVERQEQPGFPETLKTSITSETPAYKPKTVPFSSNIPVPAPTPEEFQTPEPISNSLVDYMPETIISKKERKKVEKQKKKDEKEQVKLEKERILQEKREKAARLKEDMQAVKKEHKSKHKKEKKDKAEDYEVKMEMPFQTNALKDTESEKPSLFQTLTEKTAEVQSGPFVPFTASKKSATAESSNLRIIPNVADIDKESSNVRGMQSEPNISQISSTNAIHDQSHSKEKKGLIICAYCGAMLSSDYAFCNKCGAKL